jgi:sugar-specific transcriptional regulator TrmB
MNNIPEEVLKGLIRFGLSKNEARLYLALRELHTAGVHELARRAHVNRGSAYKYVQSLAQRGLCSVFEQNRKTYCSLCAGNGFDMLIDQEESKIRGAEHLAHSFLSRVIQNIAPLKGGKYKPEIRYYEGVEGINVVYNEILEYKGIFSYFHSSIFKIFPENIKKFVKAVKKNHIVLKEIIDKADVSEQYVKNVNNRLHEVRFLPENISMEMDYFVYGDYLTFIDFNSELPVSIIIKHKDIAETARTLFHIVWNALGE